MKKRQGGGRKNRRQTWNGTDQIPATLLARGARNAKYILPAKYRVAETSDIAVKVEEKSNYYEFELKD